MTGNQHRSMEEQLENFYRTEKRHLSEKILLLQALEQEFGVGVRNTVREERARSVCSQWEEIAKQTSGVTIKDLIETLWEPMQKRGIVQYEVEKSEDDRICLQVTGCLFAKLVEELNISRDWGYDLYCIDDEYMVKGFNQKMEFTRSKTLMEGHDCCNHCYRLTE